MTDTAIRLMCSYKDQSVAVDSIERVEMLAMESDPLQGFENQVGFWLELRGDAGKLLYRQVMTDPFRQDVEVFVPPGATTDAVSRAPRNEVAGHLVLLVPDLPDAREVALVRAEGDPATQKRKVLDVAVLPIPSNGGKEK